MVPISLSYTTPCSVLCTLPHCTGGARMHLGWLAILYAHEPNSP
jgi:hypothetical protein